MGYQGRLIVNFLLNLFMYIQRTQPVACQLVYIKRLYFNLLLFLHMGAEMCCSLEGTANKFRGDLYQIEAFQIVNPLENDPIVQKWMSENKNSADTTQQSQQSNDKFKFMKLKSGEIYYYCNWANSLAQGKGFVYKPNVLFFDGFFNQGMPEGKAKVLLINQMSEYEGDVKGFRAHGKGQLRNTKNNYVIDGEWQSSHLQNCIITFKDDKNIETIKITNFETKFGSISYKDTRVYQGTIDNRKLVPHGTGKLTFPSNSFKAYYDGEWYKGQICGKGKLVYRNKSFYDGQFFNGLRQGFGKFTFYNGQYFQGYWHKGKQLGVGAIYSIVGETIKYGMWENGVLKQEISKQKWQQLSELEKSKHSKIIGQQENESKKQQQSHYQIKITQSKLEYQSSQK